MNEISFARLIKSICFLAVVCAVLVTPGRCEEANEIPLWPLGAPEAKGTGPADGPTILLYLPSSQKPTPAVVVCPGGGYTVLALDHEGRQVAEWLNDLGIAAFVLKYRIAPRYHFPVPLLDAQRALRYVRANAKLYNLVPNQVGIMGFSAGGQLAAMAATHFDEGKASAADAIDRTSSRPDFLVLAYPVISCTAPFSHAWSCKQLLGDHPDPKLAELVSNEKQVTPKTPPTFLFHTDDDDGVSPENSLAFYTALRKAGVPAELHIYEHGRHGVGLALDDPVLSSWPKRLADWFRVRGLLPKNPLPEDAVKKPPAGP
jgi:acetyl esterase/lipase